MKTLLFDLDGTLVDRDGLLFGGEPEPNALEQVLPEPAVLALLEHLARRFRIAIITNGSGRRQRAKLQRSGVGRYAMSLTISGEIGARKPDRRAFERACHDAACSRADVMMIGDDPECDILGAAAAGIETCWVGRGRSWEHSRCRPDHTISDVLCLRELLQC